MSGGVMSNKKLQKIMTQPINLIFRFFTQRMRVQIWLYEQPDMRIEGRIMGFDEYMNMVLDDAEEVYLKKRTRIPVGRILLKGENVTLIMAT
ncbi:small nuclear ribonucleoprotein E, putative [Toxoplasma gondii ME49]|uniref:Small nuclear ribonucleoprotein E n=14 Tax=Toxoplasma gondii TaxID=5811 RepID=B9PX68_TOXGV|nr:small nuclear ribonucleoprotein E, putative [Toxoplasma gondii ME49]EPR59263.1 putative small nuclear ribonucleoprotein E [Toxoplasma gondii GT1]ESS30178.1 putative small nuclear ribonucleoprotein E [Toxoplasma gondii VEG]KFG29946.1 putative small nuclear ribonucleoprotein E [Toxoplasma gondii GAB2-2007-GAL-DOM2]KFG37254.1 putative small nuclear ribonucleoprotein E [Toxoplasma gondii FOU]KFG47439.1 putative small nuclear ribonucleoprotein E [Toxoplasma gondii p89]KFG57962.1 putative small |eukprot:XP_008888345.1 small nuclear ribonucleoprotein E, putative [Hammondia hammondi]